MLGHGYIEVFNFYSGKDEKTFTSNFYWDKILVRDIKKMCGIYAMEIPANENVLFSINEYKWTYQGLYVKKYESRWICKKVSLSLK